MVGARHDDGGNAASPPYYYLVGDIFDSNAFTGDPGDETVAP